MHSTGIATSPTTTSTQSFHGQNSYTIPVIGLSNEIISRNYMQRLHYIVPKSATQYHLKESATTVIPEGYVLGMESSPFDSRSRLESMYDPGTRIETNANGTIEYRRIGDKRLSFVQCYYDNLISQSHQHDCKEVWTSLTHQVSVICFLLLHCYNMMIGNGIYNCIGIFTCYSYYSVQYIENHYCTWDIEAFQRFTYLGDVKYPPHYTSNNYH